MDVGLPLVHLVVYGARLQFEQEIFVEVVVFRRTDVDSSEGPDCHLRFPERDHQEMGGIALDAT